MVSKGILEGGVVSIDAKTDAEGKEDVTFTLTKKGKTSRTSTTPRKSAKVAA
jgi:hypothetical protein